MQSCYLIHVVVNSRLWAGNIGRAGGNGVTIKTLKRRLMSHGQFKILIRQN